MTDAPAPTGASGTATMAAPVTRPTAPVTPPAEPPPGVAEPGADGPARRPLLPAAVAGAIVVALVAAVAVVLLVAGGDPPKGPVAPTQAQVTPDRVALAARGLYAPTQRGGYVVLLPAGWINARAPRKLGLTDAVTARSAQDEAVMVTVGEISRPERTLGAQARKLQAGFANEPGYKKTFAGQISFPGRRAAFRVAYDTAGASAVAYAFKVCDKTMLVTARAPKQDFADVKARFGLIASTVQVDCA